MDEVVYVELVLLFTSGLGIYDFIALSGFWSEAVISAVRREKDKYSMTEKSIW